MMTLQFGAELHQLIEVTTVFVACCLVLLFCGEVGMNDEVCQLSPSGFHVWMGWNWSSTTAGESGRHEFCVHCNKSRTVHDWQETTTGPTFVWYPSQITEG